MAAAADLGSCAACATSLPVSAPVSASAGSVSEQSAPSQAAEGGGGGGSASPLTSPNANEAGPSILILGGLGFLGRHLVSYLRARRLAAHITVADKAHWATANLMPDVMVHFADKALVTCKQADLAQDAHVERVFNGQHYDIVFNLCGETRFGQLEREYLQRCVDTAAKCSRAAVKSGVRKWIEVSTAQVYKPDKAPSKETSSLKPWTTVATCRLEAERAVLAAQGLDCVILRPVIVYGAGDLTGLTPRLACASVYQASGEKMRFLWSDDLRLNVVHVDDVVAAMWIASQEAAAGSIFNIADSSDLTQGRLNTLLSQLFGIEVSCMGVLVSAFAKLNLRSVAADANDKHIPGFAELCRKHGILNTPVSAYIDEQLLRDHHLSVDGRLIEQRTSFHYSKSITLEELRLQLLAFIAQKQFPPVLKS